MGAEASRLNQRGERQDAKRQEKGTFNMLPTSKGGGGRSGERVTGFAALAIYEPNKYALTCEGPQPGKFLGAALIFLQRKMTRS